MVVQFVCIFSYSLIISEQYHPLGGYGSWAMVYAPVLCRQPLGSHCTIFSSARDLQSVRVM